VVVMLNPQKKISKKEIKEDKLVASYFRARQWAEENTRLLTYVAVGIAACIIVGFIWVKNRAEDSEKAATQLAKIETYYDENKYELAINGVPQEGAQGLQVIVDEFSGTHSGEIARLYLANSYYALGDYDKALENYKNISFDDKVIMASAYAGVASCYEAKGDYEEAGAYFEKAAKRNMAMIQAPENLQRSAWNYAAAGKKEKAIELLQMLKKEFPTSPYSHKADMYIAEYQS
jgi:tetratricopeptide (TPR) repeat protein